MFAYCNSGVYGTTRDNMGVCYKNNRNQVNTCIRRILHDPECENQCCLNRNELVPQGNYNDLEYLLDGSTSNSVESVTPETNANSQSFFKTNTLHEAQVPEYQKYAGREDVKLEMVYWDLCKDGQTGKNFCEGQTKGQLIQRNNGKSFSKRKRKRTVFTTEQIIAMEGVFKRRPYVSREERLFLTRRLNISERAIKVWFQNRRRVTENREKDKFHMTQSDSHSDCHSDSTVEEVYDDHSARLDYIESQINKTTDEYGFVTLDNNSIRELVNVIDTVLSRNIDHKSSSYKNKNSVIRSESYLMYEPISPESSPETDRQTEASTNWTPSKPEESLQRLMDIQTVLSMQLS